jgi:hypothetical protein
VIYTRSNERNGIHFKKVDIRFEQICIFCRTHDSTHDSAVQKIMVRISVNNTMGMRSVSDTLLDITAAFIIQSLPCKARALNFGLWHWILYVVGNNHSLESSFDL